MAAKPPKKGHPTAAKSKPSAEPPRQRLRKEAPSKKDDKEKDDKGEEGPREGPRESSPDRLDHQRMLNTINYQRKKGNSVPWEAYMECGSPEEKKLFLKKYLKDKKFRFLTTKEDLTEERGKKTTSKHTQGWKSKFQIADLEKLPLEHPLLESLLNTLPSRAHSYAPWAEKGEMEYYYESREENETSQSKSKKIVLAREGTVESKTAKDLEEGFHQSLTASSASQPRALEDGSVKDDPGDMEDEEKRAETKRMVKDLKKLSAVMTQTQINAIAVVSKLKELCVQKPYLKQLLDALEGELATFNPNRDSVVEVAQTAKDDNTEINILKLRNTLATGQAHLDGFRDGALKEAKPLVTTKEKKE